MEGDIKKEMTIILNFNYESPEVLKLREIDPTLECLIKYIDGVSITLKDNLYQALVRQIVGQQLSIKAADTIWGRVESLCRDFKPERINEVSNEELRAVGISKQKISYIRDLSSKIISGDLTLEKMYLMEDHEVISTLTNVKGIGRWTAEMFLIFSLGRQNVLSLGDISLQRSARWLFQNDTLDLSTNYEKWSPYNTIVSLYLWEAVNRGYVDSGLTLHQITNSKKNNTDL